MGVGKGTTARAFAKKYNVYNIDTDDLIESKEKKVVKKSLLKKVKRTLETLNSKQQTG